MVSMISALTLLIRGRLRSGIASNIECMALLVEIGLFWSDINDGRTYALVS